MRYVSFPVGLFLHQRRQILSGPEPEGAGAFSLKGKFQRASAEFRRNVRADRQRIAERQRLPASGRVFRVCDFPSVRLKLERAPSVVFCRRGRIQVFEIPGLEPDCHGFLRRKEQSRVQEKRANRFFLKRE